MIKYKKTYTDYFNYVEQDFIPCELCGGSAVEVHHIKFGKGKKDNGIENLIGICRNCHNKAHDEKLSVLHLQNIHNKFIENYERNKI